MYVDTVSSKKLGKLSRQLLDLITEIGSRRKKNSEKAFIRPSDYTAYSALKQYFE